MLRWSPFPEAYVMTIWYRVTPLPSQVAPHDEQMCVQLLDTLHREH